MSYWPTPKPSDDSDHAQPASQKLLAQQVICRAMSLTYTLNLFTNVEMQLTQLSEALGAFARLSRTHLYCHFIQVFLEVANANGPVTFHELADALGITNSAISRTVAALGDINRKGDPGYGLVRCDPDPGESRRYIVSLTAKGKALQRQLAAL